MKNNIMLAIETTVGNGSLSLFENDQLIDQWSGENKISRSDCFLPILDEFLSSNNINKKDLSLIAVSRGPGSFTGARIGLATAAALKNGLGIQCLGVSVLQAIAVSARQTMPRVVIAAVPNDKNQIIREKFLFETDYSNASFNHSGVRAEMTGNNASLLMLNDFISEIKASVPETKIFLEKTLFDLIDETCGIETLKKSAEDSELENIGDNLSIYIGRAAIQKYASDNLKVYYLNSDKNYSQ